MQFGLKIESSKWHSDLKKMFAFAELAKKNCQDQRLLCHEYNVNIKVVRKT